MLLRISPRARVVRRLFKVVGGAVLCGAWSMPYAQTSSSAGQPSVYLQTAWAERGVHTLTVGYTQPWRNWEHGFMGAQVRGYWDFSLSQWASDGKAGALQTTVLEITPSIRVVPDRGHSRFFLDAGVGSSLAHRRYVHRDKSFSTRFNFATHVGVGMALDARHQHALSLRLQHVSNGGFKKPNPGENFVQLRYALRLE